MYLDGKPVALQAGDVIVYNRKNSLVYAFRGDTMLGFRGPEETSFDLYPNPPLKEGTGRAKNETLELLTLHRRLIFLVCGAGLRDLKGMPRHKNKDEEAYEVC